MDKHIKWGILASVAAFIFMCGSIGYLALHVAHKIPDLTATVNGANTALATINKPKSGTLSMIDDTILQGRLTIDSANKVALHEETQLGTLDSDIATLFGHTDSTLSALGDTATALEGTANAATDTLDATTGTVKSAQPLLNNASTFVADLNTETKPVITQANTFLVNANALATNTDIPGILHGVNTGLVTGNHMLSTLGKVEDKETHCILFPGFKCVVTGLIVPGVQIGGAAVAAFRK